MSVDALLLLASLICFGLATFGIDIGKLNTVALGLFFFALVPFLHAI